MALITAGVIGEYSLQATGYRLGSCIVEQAPERFVKDYKILSQKDKFFSSTFDPELLERAINAYAEMGWEVVSMTTASIPAFGGPRDEVIVL